MKDLLYWLKKKPTPVAILADERRIEIGKAARVWNELVNTIKALEPDKLTCLDGAGNVIRSHVFDDDSKPVATPEMSDVQLFAKLIAEAYEKGSKTSQPLVDNAMQFVERQSVRLAKAEAEIERLRGQLHKLLNEMTAGNAPPAEDSVIGAMVAGMLQAQATQTLPSPLGATPPPPAANGSKGAKK